MDELIGGFLLRLFQLLDCAGDDDGCFEYGGGCEQEPVMRFRRLDETWRLARVRINQPRSLRAPVTTKATPIINKKG